MASKTSAFQILGLLGLALVACRGKEANVFPAGSPPSTDDEAGSDEDPITSVPELPPEPPGTLVTVPTDLGDPIAQAICRDVARHKAGTFIADPIFGVDDATSVSATVESYQPGGSPDPWAMLSLNFHRPTQRGTDPNHGAFVHETTRRLRTSVGGKYPEVSPGTYEDQRVWTEEHRSLCYADALGADAYESDTEELSGTKVVIASNDGTTIEGVITTKDGYRLDFKAPIEGSSFPAEGPVCCLGFPIPAGTPPKLAPKCEARTGTRTFTATPSFGFAEGTKLDLYLHERYFTDGRAGAFFFLDFRAPSTATTSTYGDARVRRRTTISVPLEAGYPLIPPGTYDASAHTSDDDEVCYPNGLGSSTPSTSTTPHGSGKLTITASTSKQIAGFLELVATDGVPARRLDFDMPITDTPDEPPTHPPCCTE